MRQGSLVTRQAEWNRHLRVLTAELLETYPEGEALREFIERQIAQINAYYMAGSPWVLYRQLVNASPALSRATVADALARPASVTKQFAWDALAKLMQQNPADGLDYAVRFAGRILVTCRRRLVQLLALWTLRIATPRRRNWLWCGKSLVARMNGLHDVPLEVSGRSRTATTS